MTKKKMKKSGASTRKRQRKFSVKEIRFRQHKTPEALVRAFLPKGTKLADVAVGLSNDGETVTSEESGHDFVKAVTRNGFWGFADTREGVIHFWENGKTSAATLCYFFGHELGHLTGKPARGMVAEERRADEYATVAERAFQQALLLGKVRVKA